MSRSPHRGLTPLRMMALGAAVTLVLVTLVGGVVLYLQQKGGAGATADGVATPALPSAPTLCAQGESDPRCATPPFAGPLVDLDSGSPAAATEPVQRLVDPAELQSAAPPAEAATPLATLPAPPPPPLTSSVKSAALGPGLLGLPWLKQQPREYFTLQLMVSSQVETLHRLVQEKQLAQPLAVASFTQGGKVLHALLQGSHATRGAADSAAERLQKTTGLAPWVRGFSSLPPLLAEETPLPTPPAPAATAATAPALAGAAWLWSRNPGHYTLQLFGAGSEGAILAYVGQYQLRGELALVTVQRAGKPWKLLLTGEYETVTGANQALTALPAPLKGGSPWARTFASLQDEMMHPARAPPLSSGSPESGRLGP